MTLRQKLCHLRHILPILLLSLPPIHAQTGQALLGNPLLSPAKIKEVRRQIAEAANPQPAAPTPAQPVFPVPMASMTSDNAIRPQGLPIGDMARQAMLRLQVMAIVDKSAVLAMSAPVSTDAMSPQQFSMQAAAMQSLGGQAIMQGQVLPASVQAPQYARRQASTIVRDHEAAYIEGYDVIPVIRGNSVRLLLAASNATIFQGEIQPTLRTPSLAIGQGAVEKSSSDYAQGASPDATSMSPAISNASQNGGNPQPLVPAQQQIRP